MARLSATISGILLSACAINGAFSGELTSSGHIKVSADYAHSPLTDSYTDKASTRINTEYTQGHARWLLAAQSHDQHIDRMAMHWRHDQQLWVIGRDSISWGNGLIFNPADVFNPFSPTAIDTEYKPGVDLLYLQQAMQNGDDWQLLYVQHENKSSQALRYHHVGESLEWSGTLARHYDDYLANASWSLALENGSLLSGDIIASQSSEAGITYSGVVNAQHWFSLGEHSLGLLAEFYFNGFGVSEVHEVAIGTSAQSALLERIASGELYNLGRRYLATGLQFDPHPLWFISLNNLTNLDDHSSLLYLNNRIDSGPDSRINVALFAPWGSSQGEFTDNLNGLNQQLRILAQFAWYF